MLHRIFKETCRTVIFLICRYICHVVVLSVTLSNLYAVERQISMFFIDNKDSVFCIVMIVNDGDL